jgi:hypothetical protein
MKIQPQYKTRSKREKRYYLVEIAPNKWMYNDAETILKELITNH